MQRAKIATVVTVVLLICGMLASLLAPTPHGNDWLTFHAYFAVAVGAAVSFMGGSILFIMGLGGFTDRLKAAYRMICISLVALALAFAQLPITLYLADFSSYWKGSGALASGVCFLLALVLIYAGSRALARLFGVNSSVTKVWVVIAGTVGFAAVTVLAPHAQTTTSESALRSALGSTALSSFIIGTSALLMFQIKRTASVMYTNVLAWMTLSYGLLSLGGVVDIIAIKALGDQQWYLIGAFPLIPLFIGGLFMLRAAYSFNTITAVDTHGWVARNFFRRPLQPKTEAATTSVDIVVCIANLVSNPRNIDSVLDRMRAITARQNQGTQISLSVQDEQTLKQVYLDIEEYLLNKEPVRKFTRESIRAHVAKSLQPSLSPRPTFWKELVAG